MNTTTPTPAIVVYWRFRYAEAPSWTAAEIERIRSLPGDRASSVRGRDDAVDDGAGGAHERDHVAVVRQKAGQEVLRRSS